MMVRGITRLTITRLTITRLTITRLTITRLTITRLTILLALCIAFLVGLSASPAAAIDGMSVESTTTYTIDGAAGVVHVQAQTTFTNTIPDRRTDNIIKRAYLEGFALPAPVGSINEAAVTVDGIGAGAPLTITGRAVDGDTHFMVYDINFASRLFYGKTTTITTTYDITGPAPRSEGPSRINAAYAAFDAYGIGDAGKVTVRVVAPKGFAVDTFGDTAVTSTEGDNTIYTATAIKDPDTFNIFISARNDDGLTNQDVANAAGDRFNVRAWPGDTEWQNFLATQVNDGVPVLAELIGTPWPIHESVEIRQAYTPYLYGYAGWFSAAKKQIEIGEDLDQEVALHELSHAWFSEAWFDDRWLSEGYAQTYANLAKTRLGGTGTEPKSIDTADPGHVTLNQWGNPQYTDGADAVEAYGYNAAWSVVSQISTDLGEDKTRQVFAAIDQGTTAYIGKGQPEQVDGAADWKRYLDLVDEIGGSTKADQLIEQYVATADQVAELTTRKVARDRYHSLQTVGGEWTTPQAVRQAMADWSFTRADTLMSAATDVLAHRDQLTAASAALGVSTPAGLQSAYESATVDLAAPAKQINDQLDATNKLATAVAAEARGDGVFGGVGLIGTTLRSELADARVALAAGKTDQVRSAARHVDEVIAKAPDLGKRRAALAIGGLVLFLACFVATIVVLRGRRRRAPALAPSLQ